MEAGASPLLPATNMRFLRPENENLELTYNDVFLMPRYSDVTSRMDVDIAPSGSLHLNTPVILANMTSVAGKRMAETIARRGGLVIFTQDVALERIEKMVSHVKNAHKIYDTPIVLKEDDTIQKAMNLIFKRSHKAIIVVDDESRPIGIFTEKDAVNRDLFSSVKNAMRKDLVTVPDGLSSQEYFDILDKHRLSLAPVVSLENKLLGIITRNGAVRSSIYQPAVNKRGELMTAATIRVSRDIENSVERLMNIGIDAIVVDTAHGHQKRMLDAVRQVREMVGIDFPIAAGNIVTQDAAQDLINAGASILKVGVGPGAACTTRMMAGVGRPQFSAVKSVADIARPQGIDVWADGGIKHPRDVALALAAGANCAFIGSWFAGTHESPADAYRDSDGRLYKEQFGMASHRAVAQRVENDAAWNQARKEFFKEGTSRARMYLKEGQESAEDILDSITAGLRSACTYSGARNLREFYDNAVVGVQTSSGFEEGKAVRESW